MSKRKLIVTAPAGAALLVALVCLLAACGAAAQPAAQAGSRASSSPGAAPTVEQVYQRYGSGVVGVAAAPPASAGGARTAADGAALHGVGFAWSRALILTSARLVDHNGSIAKTAIVTFRTDGGQTRRTVGAIVCVDAALDLAVIRIDPAQAGSLVALPMGDSSGLRAGQPLTLLGGTSAASSAPVLTVTTPRRALRATSGVALQAAVLSGAPLAGAQ